MQIHANFQVNLGLYLKMTLETKEYIPFYLGVTQRMNEYEMWILMLLC